MDGKRGTEQPSKASKSDKSDKKKNKNKAKATTPTPAAAPIKDDSIDALFDMVKQKKQEKTNKRPHDDNDNDDTTPLTSNKKPSLDQSSSSLPYGVIKSNMKQIVNPEAPVERVDPESGYRVYKAHLLKVGEGGGTPLCPFDCDCCF